VFSNFGDLLKNIPAVKTKDDCVYIKLANFGNTKSTNNCLNYDVNILSVKGDEGDYNAGIISIGDAAKSLVEHKIKALLYTSLSHTTKAPLTF